jgi:hypothetical protein
MSPQLHAQLYGFHQHQFIQASRQGGWRPTVFMNHGLQVAIWMGSCWLLAFAQLLHSGNRVRNWGVVCGLGITFLLLKSFGAVLLTLLVAVTLAAAKWVRSPWPLLICPILLIGHLSLRAINHDPTTVVIDFVAENVSQERARSLQFRMDNESLLLEKALQKPVFGWGGWGRNRVIDESGQDVAVTDGLWIIVLGTHGFLGLTSFFGLQLAGPIRLLVQMRALVPDPRFMAAAVGLSAVCFMAALDAVPNAMPIPITTVIAGAIASVSQSTKGGSSWEQREICFDEFTEE